MVPQEVEMEGKASGVNSSKQVQLSATIWVYQDTYSLTWSQNAMPVLQ